MTPKLSEPHLELLSYLFDVEDGFKPKVGSWNQGMRMRRTKIALQELEDSGYVKQQAKKYSITEKGAETLRGYASKG